MKYFGITTIILSLGFIILALVSSSIEILVFTGFLTMAFGLLTLAIYILER